MKVKTRVVRGTESRLFLVVLASFGNYYTLSFYFKNVNRKYREFPYTHPKHPPRPSVIKNFHNFFLSIKATNGGVVELWSLRLDNGIMSFSHHYTIAHSFTAPE